MSRVSYSPGFSGSKLTIRPQTGFTFTVNITGGTVTSDAAGTTAVTFPQTVNASTTYYSPDNAGLTVSCIWNGVECANGVGGTFAWLPKDGQVATIIPAPTEAQGEASDSAAYAGRWKTSLRRWPRVNTVIPGEMTTPPTFALTGPGGASPIAGGSPQQVPYNSAQVKLRGAVPALVNQFSTNYYYNAVNAAATPPPMWPSFDYYGSDLAIRFRPRTSSANDQKVWVWVDGQPATPAPVSLGTLSGGSLYYYRATFSEGVALRRISIWTTLMDFGGVDVAVTDTVAYPTDRDEKWAFYGDSWTEGANAVADIDLWAEQLPWYIGAEGFRVGQGGTGYVANGGGGIKAPFTDATRLAQLAATNADYIVIFGSINDDGLAGIQAAAASVYATLAGSLPLSKIIVVGPPGTSGSPTANRTTNRDAVKAAALAAPNVLGFIDPIASGWVTGTGHAGATAGDGNADVLIASDGAHAVDADAHAYFRSRVRSAIAAVLEAA